VGSPDLQDAGFAQAFARNAVLRRFARGQALMHQGQVADRVLLVQSGRVKITSISVTGREVVLAFRGPGDLVGELSALDGSPRSATIVAVEPVETLALAREDFLSLVASDPSISLLLLRALSRRLRDADAKRIEFASFDTMGRVAVRLVELCERFGEHDGEAVRIELPLSQEELAGWTGASIESVARALQTMRTLGWIETGRRRVRVLDLEAMHNAAR
jgi:CRP-like cAMP-binding protein